MQGHSVLYKTNVDDVNEDVDDDEGDDKVIIPHMYTPSYANTEHCPKTKTGQKPQQKHLTFGGDKQRGSPPPDGDPHGDPHEDS